MDGSYPIPDGEQERLAALRRYRILDTQRDETLDRITDIARFMFGAVRATISLVDEDRVWFKSGGRRQQVPRAYSFCTHVILGNEVFIVPDAKEDRRFRDMPLVREPMAPRFYAGAPLITRDGYCIGTLNVIDEKPRSGLTQAERQHLTTLAHLVMKEFDLRRELQARIDAERDLDLINKLMIAIAEAPDAREALERSIELLTKAVGATFGAVALAVEHGKAVQTVVAYPKLSLTAPALETMYISLDNSLTERALADGRPLIVADLAAMVDRSPHVEPKIARGVASSIIVPLEQSGGRFALHFDFANRPEDIESYAERLAHLAERIRPALARHASEESIALLQSIVLNANDAALVMMPDIANDPKSPLHIVYVNPAMALMTGYEPEEIVGKPPALLWGERTNGPVPLDRLNAPLRCELQLRRKNGTDIWADINAVPVVKKATGEKHVIAVLRDATERRRLEQALREREQTFHLMFSSAPVPMMLLDIRSQRYVEVNDYAVRLFGYSREQLLAMSAEAIRAPDELERYREMLNTPVPASGRRGLWRYIRADGEEITVDVTVHPFRFQGRPMAIIVTVDVTEQKRAEENIRRARDEAEAASRAKSDLLANMSHELRTPLNAIIGFSQILREELFGPLGSERYRNYVADILESAHHLLTVINDILDLAKIEANSFQLREGIVDPEQVAASALRLVRPRADQAGIELAQENCAEGIGLHADETALKRVLVNLLTNAVKFSEAGTRVTVRLKLTSETGLAIAVEDRGIGMAPEEIEVALTPFQQVDIGLRRKYEGTGLGLPIAKQLVELHGGRLIIESARGAGTTVTMLLPANRVIAETMRNSVPPVAAIARSG